MSRSAESCVPIRLSTLSSLPRRSYASPSWRTALCEFIVSKAFSSVLLSRPAETGRASTSCRNG